MGSPRPAERSHAPTPAPASPHRVSPAAASPTRPTQPPFPLTQETGFPPPTHYSAPVPAPPHTPRSRPHSLTRGGAGPPGGAGPSGSRRNGRAEQSAGGLELGHRPLPDRRELIQERGGAEPPLGYTNDGGCYGAPWRPAAAPGSGGARPLFPLTASPARRGRPDSAAAPVWPAGCAEP